MKLNPAQEKFAHLIVRGVGTTEAGIECWGWENYSQQAKATEAQKKLNNPRIQDRINELKAIAVKETSVTVQSLLDELDEARDLAKEEKQPSAMVAATIGKAKVTGLDKQVIEIQSREELTPWDSLTAKDEA